jgi:ESS family glutamate:Na+ symporter
MTPTTSLSIIETLAIAALGLAIGRVVVRGIPLFQRLCLPEPVLGGLILCGVFTALQASGTSIQFDTTLQTPLMIAFFLSIGWMASLRNLKRGGPDVLKFLVICSVVLVLQNLVGVVTARALGQNPLLGILAGSVSLTGGPGTALAFGPSFEKAGVVSAGSIGTACALAGIILGGLLGSPMAALLLKRTPPSKRERPAPPAAAGVGLSIEASAGATLDASHLPQHFGFFIVVMATGALVGKWINAAGITLPVYIGSMIVAAVIRNVHDSRKSHRLSEQWIDEIGSVALSYFLVVATMTLQLNQLANLAGVLVVILAIQTIVVLAIAALVVHRFSGRDYDATVMSGGFVGFMLGTTANALANMDAITSRHGAAPRAYLVVPLVGACFVDFVNAIVITMGIQLLS